MKKILFFCLIIASYSLQAQFVDDHIRARVSLRIGGNTTTAATGISNAMPGSPSTTLITAKGVYDWFTGVVTFAGDVSGPYNNLVLANSGVTAGTCTNCSLTIDAKGRVTVKGSGSAGATYTAGTGIAIDGSNVISNTAPNIVQTTITGNAGTATALQTPRTINGVAFDGTANITLPSVSESALTYSTVTATANNQIGGFNQTTTITGRATTSDNVYANQFAPSVIAGANTQALYGTRHLPVFNANSKTGTWGVGAVFGITNAGTHQTNHYAAEFQSSQSTSFANGVIFTQGSSQAWRWSMAGQNLILDYLADKASTSITRAAVIRISNSTGGVGFGTTPAASAAVDISSTTAGFLAPRMTTTQRDAISSPAEGLIIYNLTAHKLNVYTGSAWETITSL